MNENGLSWKSARARTAALAACTVAGLGLLGAMPAQGAPTRTFTLTPRQANHFQVWSNYLAQGPEVWSSTRPPAFTPAVRTTIWQVLQNDTAEQQLANPMIDYLLWRRSLAPARFSANHPNFAPQLNRLNQLLTTPTPALNIPPPTYVPVPQTVLPTPTPLIPPSKQSVSPQTVAPPPPIPEPGSLLLAAGMIGWGLWWRRRMARAASA
jgi:hypothetical protein